MLTLLDNYNYSQQRQSTIDEELTQLVELCKDGYKEEDVYEYIRSRIYKQIKIEELAVTRVLQDLLLIREQSNRAFQVLSFFICNSHLSFQQISEVFGCTKQNIHSLLGRYAKQLPWLDNLLKIKKELDGKGGGRSIFYTDQKQKTMQMELFQDQYKEDDDDDDETDD